MLKHLLISIFCCLLTVTGISQPDNIPGAQAGKCYAKCLMPDKYEFVTEQVVLRPASFQTTILPATFETATGQYVSKDSFLRLTAEPAVFETVEEKIQIAPPGRKVNPGTYQAVEESILIKPAVKYFVVTQAQFETVQEAVEIEPAYMELEALPRRFEPVIQKIEVRPASTQWVRKKVDRNCLGADPDDCFVWCLVERPAEYQSFFGQVDLGCSDGDPDNCVVYKPVAAKTTLKPVQKVKTPASARELVEAAEYRSITKWTLKPGAATPTTDGPGEFITVSKKVLKTPAHLREEMTPAEYKTIARKTLKSEASDRTEPLPEQSVAVLKRMLIKKGGFSEWREILCGEKLSGYTVRQVQEALRALGYYKGTIDGALGAQTITAIAQFQQERDLPADGNLDFETLKALGVGY